MGERLSKVGWLYIIAVSVVKGTEATKQIPFVGLQFKRWPLSIVPSAAIPDSPG